MSYILDALKKLEHEKSQKFRKDGIAGLSGVLYENERPKPARTVVWKISLAVTVAVLVTFGVTWNYLQSGTVPGNILPQRTATDLHAPPATIVSSIKVEAAPLPPAPLVAPSQNTPAPVQAKLRPAIPSAVHSPIAQIAAQAVVPVIAEDAASIVTQQELRKRLKDRKGQTMSASQSMAPPADIKLSGIAYQDERRARRAVVNGFLMQEGGVVSGAVITDIFQDRVRFLLAGRNFELSLVSSGASQ